MRHIPNTLAVCALMLTGVLAAVPSHASKFGKPSLYVITGKIAPPYDPSFNLQTAVSAWPSLISPPFLTEKQANPQGELAILYEPDVLDTLANVAHAYAHANGIYGVSAEMDDPVTITSYVGLFSYSQIHQRFVKDSLGAYCHYHIGYLSPANVYSRESFAGDVRSEFAIDIDGVANARQFSQFHQAAGVRAWAGGSGPTFHQHVAIGPMTYTDSYPSLFGYDELVAFDPYTGSLDLSSLNVDDTFEVHFRAMAQVAWIPGDNPRGFASIVDPAGGGGITIEVAGVHALDDAQNGIVAVGDGGPAMLASLSPARPNPSRGAVAFRLELPRDGEVSVDVFDLSGRRIGTLARGPFRAGTHTLTWDPRDGRNGAAPSGVYFVRAHGPGLDTVRRVVRLAEK